MHKMKWALTVVLLGTLIAVLGCGGGGGDSGSPVAATANNSISGTISFPTGSSASVTAKISLDASFSGMKIRLVDVNESDLVSPVSIDGVGFFTFPNVPSGNNYRLIVTSKGNKKLLQKHLDNFSTSQSSVKIDPDTTAYAILVKESGFTKSESQIIDAVSQGKVSVKGVSDKITEWLKGVVGAGEMEVEKAIVSLIGALEIQKIISNIPSSTVPTSTTKKLIEISLNPTSITTQIGGILDLSKIAATAKYDDNSTQAVSVIWSGTGVVGNNFSASIAGSVTLTCSYSEGGVKKTSELVVTVQAKAKTVKQITISPASATVKINGSYDLSKVVVTALYDDKSSQIVAAAWSGAGVGGSTFTAPSSGGVVPLTCSYEEAGISVTAEFSVTVSRFVKDADGVITDGKTGLQWFKGPNPSVYPQGKYTWYNVQEWAANLSVGGGGWRMPTMAELRPLYPEAYPTGFFPPTSWSADIKNGVHDPAITVDDTSAYLFIIEEGSSSVPGFQREYWDYRSASGQAFTYALAVRSR